MSNSLETSLRNSALTSALKNRLLVMSKSVGTPSREAFKVATWPSLTLSVIEIIKMIPFTERTPPGVSMAGLMPPSSPGVSISVKRDMMPGVIRQLLVATATVVTD